MFRKILIANRGEIACRIMSTARRMGIASVAVYSDADRNSRHVTEADEAYYIGASVASQSYLNIDAIISAALQSGAQAIHPGYGFLSENPEFATAVAKAGLVFIGPSIHAMKAMASKQVAKQMLENTTVPLTPGYHGHDQSDATLFEQAKLIGFPVLLKAAAGGGGKGMRTVLLATDFSSALASARREAKAYFADDTMLIEKLLLNPRHIEIQLMADHFGQIVHLFERDCSIQRRHQKIIEEAPAPNLSNQLRKNLADAAIAVAKTIQYLGAGTVEFLVDEHEKYYFMEMNTRLQVEHPVTEMITGLDLVEWQLRIAAKEPLPCDQSAIQANGHAIECRIYAEDPANQFIPSIGTIQTLSLPRGAGVRVDSGVQRGSQVSQFYDAMIAKLIVWGVNREQALSRLQLALQNYHLRGVKTNLPFLQAIIAHANFQTAKLSTEFLSKELIEIPQPDTKTAAMMAACVTYFTSVSQKNNPLQQQTLGWQMHLTSHWQLRFLIENVDYKITLSPLDNHTVRLELSDCCVDWHIKLTANRLTVDNGQRQWHTDFETLPNALVFYTEFGTISVTPYDWLAIQTTQQASGKLTAPMPASVVAILKQKGDRVKTGDSLMVLEAMKMEHTVHAPSDGVLSEILYEIGSQVEEGAELVVLATPH